MALHPDRLAPLLATDPVIGLVRAQALAEGVPCWLVGGAVRDGLLGRTPKDADFVYVHDREGQSLPERLAAARNAPCIRYTRELEVERVVLAQKTYDFVRIPHIEALSADLARRDFTVNALAVRLDTDAAVTEIIDEHDGLADLAAQTLRFTSEGVIADDPLRMLRAYRLALQLRFALPAETQALCRQHRDLLARPSGERVRDELLLILGQPGGASVLTALCDSGLLEIRFPALTDMREVAQNGYHHLPVWEHTLECVHQLEAIATAWPDELAEFAPELDALCGDAFVMGRPRLALMKLALLFHDLGKPLTKATREDGVITFLQHDVVSCTLMRPYLEDLKLSREEIDYIDCLVRQHLRPGFLDLDAPTARRMVHRYFAALGDYGVDLALISIADRLAAQGPLLQPKHLARHWRIVAHLCEVYWRERETVVAPPPLVNGDEVQALLGIGPGPRVGEILRGLKEAQAMGEVSSREEALAWAEAYSAPDAAAP